MRETKGQKIFKVFNYTFLGLLGLITFYPFWYVLVASLNTGRDFMRGGVWFFPRDFTWENYAKAFADDRIAPALKISVEATLITVVVSLLFTALVAYALTVKTLPGRTIFSFFWYFTTIFNGGVIPYFIVLRDLKLTSSFWLYVIPGLFSFYNMVLMRANFAGIPYELRESAQLDGAGEWTILSRIYLPLSKPILATLALYIGVGKWNDWFTGAYYQSKAALYPAATVLQRLLAEASAGSQVQVGQETLASGGMTSYTSQSLQMAFVMILTMPIVIVYPFLQKYYVKGVMVGSVKG